MRRPDIRKRAEGRKIGSVLEAVVTEEEETGDIELRELERNVDRCRQIAATSCLHAVHRLKAS